MAFVGIDIGKEACSATVLTRQGRVKARLDFPNRIEGFQELQGAIGKRDTLVIEAGTYAYPIHDWFTRLGWKVLVGHPRGIRQITESEKKTDRHDSEVLAQLARVDYLPRAYIPHPDILRNREVLRTRLDMAYQSTRVKTRVRSFLGKQGLEPPEPLFPEGLGWLRLKHWNDSRDLVLGVMVDELEDLAKRRTKIDRVLAELAIDSPDVQILMSVPGIDYYLALMIACEVGDVSRFPTREAFRTYTGCAPRMRESAGRNVGKGTNTNRSPRLKTAISLASQTAVRYENPIRDAYQKRLAKTRSQARAYSVARRKMSDLVYTLLTKGEPCCWANPASVERKLTNLERTTNRKRGLPTPP